MKKIMKRIGIGIILCIICFCAYGWFREINPIVMKAHADLDVPENLEDLEGKTVDFLMDLCKNKGFRYMGIL